MRIIGCDYHPGFQVVAIFDNRTGEVEEKKLLHPQEAEAFYRGLSEPARVGMEASGHSQWFQRLLGECGHELWIGDAARIRAAEVRKQKTDRRDAAHILDLLLAERFPRIWVPSAEERDARQLLLHRHQRVRLRTQAKNQLQALALNQGLQRRGGLWSVRGRQQLSAMELAPYAARRRAELLADIAQLDRQIAELDQLVEREAMKREAARQDEQLKRAYRRLSRKKSRAVAKVMVARRLAVRLYWMLRKQWTYAEWVQHAGQPGSSPGAR